MGGGAGARGGGGGEGAGWGEGGGRGRGGWGVTTGGGGGFMAAGHGGAGADPSFGLAIRLPFEQATNPHIANDPKLINFKYFFTRKLMFVRSSHAIALFPGGFGTMDEGFEVLTLVQTGKSVPVPIDRKSTRLNSSHVEISYAVF